MICMGCGQRLCLPTCPWPKTAPASTPPVKRQMTEQGRVQSQCEQCVEEPWDGWCPRCNPDAPYRSGWVLPCLRDIFQVRALRALREYLDSLDEQTRRPGEPPLREAVAQQARERLAEIGETDG